MSQLDKLYTAQHDKRGTVQYWKENSRKIGEHNRVLVKRIRKLEEELSKCVEFGTGGI